MGRFFVLFLCCGLISSGIALETWAQPLPKLAPKLTPKLVIAVFQKLDDSKKLPPLLALLQKAYTKRTSEATISSNELKKRLGHYGPKLFGQCKLKAACLSQKMKKFFPNVQYGLFLGVGGLGDAVLLNMVLIDLRTGKEAKRLNQAFSNQNDANAKLPQVMKQLFPNYASIRWQGLPSNSTATINGRIFEKPQNWVGVPANQTLQIVLQSSGFRPDSRQVKLTPNSQITQIVKLVPNQQKPDLRLGKGKVPPSRPSPKSQPITRKWWLWTLVGLAAAGAAAGVTVGVLASQRKRTRNGFIPVDVPSVQETSK